MTKEGFHSGSKICKHGVADEYLPRCILHQSSRKIESCRLPHSNDEKLPRSGMTTISTVSTQPLSSLLSQHRDAIAELSNQRLSDVELPIIVITFYSPSCLGQETAKGPFSLRVKLPPVQCPPVYHTRRRLHTVPLIAKCQVRKLRIPILIAFGLTRPGIEPESTTSVELGKNILR